MRLSNVIAKWLLATGAISHKDEKIYKYIIHNFLFSCTPLVLTFIISSLLQLVVEGIIMILPFLFIRKFSGGFHFKSQSMCLFSSIVLLSTALLLIQNILKTQRYSLYSYFVYFSLAMLCLFSPIDCEERRLTQNQKKSFKKITIYMCLCFLLIFSILTICREWNLSVPLGIGIVIPAFLQLPCIVRNLCDKLS